MFLHLGFFRAPVIYFPLTFILLRANAIEPVLNVGVLGQVTSTVHLFVPGSEALTAEGSLSCSGMLLSSAKLRKGRNKHSVISFLPKAAGYGQHLKRIERNEQLEVGSAVSSETSMTTERSGASHFSPQSSIGVAESSILMSRLEEAILSSVREGGQSDNYALGLEDAFREKRDEWLSIENELHRVQGLASRSVQESAIASQLKLLEQVREAIVDAMHFLLEGYNLLVDTNDAEVNPFRLASDSYPKGRWNGKTSSTSRKYAHNQAPKYYVWSSPQLARSAIIQEAITVSLKQSNESHMMNARPLVVLVIERCPNLAVAEEGEDEIDPQQLSEQESFLSAWTRATFGIADAITVAVENSNQMRLSIHKVLKGASEESSVVPALVCLHASGDSAIPSDISTLRTTCDLFGARLCIEGSALALVGQPNRPSDPEECVRKAHVLLLDPGAWFGFKMCAVVTKHEPHSASDTPWSKNQQQKAASIDVLASCDNDDKHGLATGSVLNLWTVLSKIGLVEIRNRIEDVTSLAESFLHGLESSPNVHATYDGIGCVVRISYAMSREDRLMNVEKAAENVSKVNKAIALSLQLELKSVMMHSSIAENNTYLQFSPSRFLRSGTFWFPSGDEVDDYVAQIQETMDKFEPCRAGRVEFEGRVAKCRDMNLIVNEEEAPGLCLCFGAFRVVPHELSTSWRETTSSLDVVRELTNLLVSELNESLADIISKRFALQQELERSGVASKQKRTEQRRLGRNNRPSELQSEHPEGDDLPFVIFLNSNLENGAPEFISIEPKEACTPVQAVRHARLAAELIMATVDVISCRWRRSHQISAIPRDLANVAGKEDFIPTTASREGLGYMSQREDAPLGELSGRVQASTQKRSSAKGYFGTGDDEHIFVETDSDDGSFHSVLDYGDGNDGTSDTTEQDSERGDCVDNHQESSEEVCSKKSNTDNIRACAVENSYNQMKSESTEAATGELKRAFGRNMVWSRASALAAPAAKAQTGNPPSPNSIQPRTRSHWLGIWSRGDTKSSPSQKDGSNSEGGESTEDYYSEDDYIDENDEAEDGRESSASSSGSDEDHEDDAERNDEEEEEETSESDEEDEDEESSESVDAERETWSDVESKQVYGGRSAVPSGFLSWFSRRGGSSPVASTAAGDSEESSSGEESTLSSSEEEEAESVQDAAVSPAGSSGLSRQGEWESEEEADDEDTRNEGDSSDSEEQVAGGTAKSSGNTGVLIGPAGTPSAFGLAWLRRRWAGRQAAATEEGKSEEGEEWESVEDEDEGGGGTRAVVDVESSEEDGGYSEDSEDGYFDESGQEEYSGEDEGFDSSRSGSGSYDSAVDESESETESETEPRDQAEKGRVSRYLGWLAPSWTGVATAASMKTTTSRARHERYGSEESSSESEKEVLPWRGRAAGRRRAATRRR